MTVVLQLPILCSKHNAEAVHWLFLWLIGCYFCHHYCYLLFCNVRYAAVTINLYSCLRGPSVHDVRRILATLQGDHFTEKPGNVGEFNVCQGNVGNWPKVGEMPRKCPEKSSLLTSLLRIRRIVAGFVSPPVLRILLHSKLLSTFL